MPDSTKLAEKAAESIVDHDYDFGQRQDLAKRKVEQFTDIIDRETRLPEWIAAVKWALRKIEDTLNANMEHDLDGSRPRLPIEIELRRLLSETGEVG
jgi:hypothetical protein